MKTFGMIRLTYLTGIAIVVFGLLPAGIAWLVGPGEWGEIVSLAWLSLIAFAYIGISWRMGMLERTYDGYLVFRTLFLFAAVFLLGYYSNIWPLLAK